MEILTPKAGEGGNLLSRLNIHFDNQIFLQQKYGGISRYFVRLVKGLQDLGHSPKVLGGVYLNSYLGELDASLVKGVQLTKVPRKGLRALFQAGEVYNKMWQLLDQPDIIHETYFSSSPVLTRRSKARVVTYFDALNERFPEMFPPDQLRTKEKQAAFDRSDLVFCISEHTKKDLMELFRIEERKIKVAYLAADLPLSAEEVILPKVHGRPFFLFVGIRMPHKNFEGLLKALAASPRLKKDFDLVSIANFGFSTREKELMDSLGFQQDQIRHVQADDRELAGYYSTAVALVYPSLYEGFGLPPLEAMSYGCQVVCSNSSSLPEVVGEAAELFDPWNQEELTAAMERVAFDPSRRESLIALGKEQVGKFSWEKTAREHLNGYQALA